MFIVLCFSLKRVTVTEKKLYLKQWFVFIISYWTFQGTRFGSQASPCGATTPRLRNIIVEISCFYSVPFSCYSVFCVPVEQFSYFLSKSSWSGGSEEASVLWWVIKCDNLSRLNTCFCFLSLQTAGRERQRLPSRHLMLIETNSRSPSELLFYFSLLSLNQKHWGISRWSRSFSPGREPTFFFFFRCV